MPDYQELYSKTLEECVESVISNPILAEKSSVALYEALLTSGVSKVCNDAALILHQMSRLQCRGWPDFVARKNVTALKKATSDTLQLIKNLRRATDNSRDSQFAEIIRRGAGSIQRSLNIGGGKRPEYVLDLDKASGAFLTTATAIETLLMELLLEKEEALYDLWREDLLSSKMGTMTLTAVVN